MEPTLRIDRMNSFYTNFKIILTTEFYREFFTKRTIAFLGVFVLFTGLILFILQDNLSSSDNTVDVTAEVWTYTLGNISIAFFGGLIGVSVSAYIGGIILVKDLKNGPMRLQSSYPVHRSNLYFARITNGALMYIPLSVMAGLTVMTIGILQGVNFLNIELQDFIEVYVRTTLSVILIIFLVGFLAATLSNLIGIYSGNETQGVIMTVVLVVFGDLIVSLLSAFVPTWNLEYFSLGYHRSEVLKYFFQADVVGANGGPGTGSLVPADVAAPWLSIILLFLLPVIFVLLGYRKFKNMDLE